MILHIFGNLFYLGVTYFEKMEEKNATEDE